MAENMGCCRNVPFLSPVLIFALYLQIPKDKKLDVKLNSVLEPTTYKQSKPKGTRGVSLLPLLS